MGSRRSWYDLGTDARAYLAACKRRKRGQKSPHEQRVEEARAAADAFNAAYPVGTPVRYWTWTREGEGAVGRVRHPAQVMSDHASVWVTGHASCIALTHVEPIAAEPTP